ncbi:MAG: NAD(P)H-hydrate dehydratase [Chloroflexota bacterium]
MTVAQMTAIEHEADAAGLTYAQMMENAGAGLAESIQDLPFEEPDRAVLGLVGPGNNGGDTLVALSILATSGWQARAYLVKPRNDALVGRLHKAGGDVASADGDQDYAILSSFIVASAILLDGLLGTGAKRPIRGEVSSAMAAVNRLLGNMEQPPYVIAVDCPSGIDCDTGEASDQAIPADLTVTMACVKQGLLRMPAYDLAGDLRVVDIGLPSDLPSLQSIQTEVVDANLVARILPSRPSVAHKGTFGSAMIAAGSVNYTGAAFLAGSAAYRAGAGLVTLAIPTPLHAPLAGRLPEATWLLLPHELGVISRDASQVLLDGLGSSTALLVGPGLGTHATTREFIARLLSELLPPLVVDADGLNLLARIEGWNRLLSGTAVLTPHPGEMSVLTGLSTEEIQKDRTSVASSFAKSWGHVVVLKGAFTIVASPQGQIAIIPVASAALARAGTGDVLAGMIVGLRAQGVGPYEAAVAGAWMHAQAGLYAARRLGNTASVLAGDVLDALAEVISDLSAV